MAVLSTSNPTLLDLASRMDPGNKVAAIVELLSQSNPLLDDMGWIEGNLPTGHRTTVRTGLPTVTFRGLNEGVTPSKSTTAQITEDCAELAALCSVDSELVRLNGNTAAFRLSESMAFIEAMNQQMTQTVIYGNAATSPKSFTGLAPRYNLTTGATGQNIINAGTVTGGDGTSIYLVVWGPNTVTGIYPQGSTAGLYHEDKGEILIPTSSAVGISTGMINAFVDRWMWKCGLVVRDWRYVVRIANIDVSNLVAEAGAADLTKLMIKAIHRIPSMAMGRPVFYVSRSVREMLDIQALNKASSQLTLENFDGKRITAFQGIPIRTVDQILETEAQIS